MFGGSYVTAGAAGRSHCVRDMASSAGYNWSSDHAFTVVEYGHLDRAGISHRADFEDTASFRCCRKLRGTSTASSVWQNSVRVFWSTDAATANGGGVYCRD